MNIGIIILIIALILVIWFIATYNGLISSRNSVKTQFAQMDVQLKRRSDLIPNLVETVKGYANHESETLEKVVKARNQYANAATPEDKIKASGELSGLVSRLLMLQESYPDLKANTNFIQLQTDLKETEDKISVARQFYNDTVLRYNNMVEKVPSNLVASLCKFEKEPFFKIDEAEKEAPKVSFDDKKEA